MTMITNGKLYKYHYKYWANRCVENHHGNGNDHDEQDDNYTVECDNKYHVKQHPVVIDFVPPHLIEVKDPHSHLGIISGF